MAEVEPEPDLVGGPGGQGGEVEVDQADDALYPRFGPAGAGLGAVAFTDHTALLLGHPAHHGGHRRAGSGGGVHIGVERDDTELAAFGPTERVRRRSMHSSVGKRR